jgi:sRNA-binding carbon storage regulator CsrA
MEIMILSGVFVAGTVAFIGLMNLLADVKVHRKEIYDLIRKEKESQ